MLSRSVLLTLLVQLTRGERNRTAWVRIPLVADPYWITTRAGAREAQLFIAVHSELSAGSSICALAPKPRRIPIVKGVAGIGAVDDARTGTSSRNDHYPWARLDAWAIHGPTAVTPGSGILHECQCHEYKST